MRKLLVSILSLCFAAGLQAAVNWSDVDGVTAVNKSRPSGISNGIYYGADGTSVTLCTYAASKSASAKRVFLIGDMNNWTLSKEYQMYKDGNYFWIELTGLEAGKEYRLQYAVERSDGKHVQISDVYSEKVIHPDDQYEPRTVDPSLISYPTGKADGGYVTVIQPGKPQFEWSAATLNFKRPNKDNLIIYEVWVYDYTTGTNKRNIRALQNRLDYIQNLGVNAIELMPICEFEGNQSWGYNPTHYFAPDKTYGNEKAYKTFIDECHKRGIAVILDMVFNHATAQNPMNKLYSGSELSSNPWFNVNVPHEDAQGYAEDWNHDFKPAHEMFTRSLQYWLKEYKVDGFRLDLSHGLCGTSYNAVKNLKAYYAEGVKAVSNDAYLILEHWHHDGDRPDLINAGMLCWMNTNPAYLQTAMGWLKPDDDGHTDGFGEANKDGYVSYCESHDEERMQYKCKMWGNGSIKTNVETRVARVPENVAFNVLLNGSHMLWQFEELGYDYSINSAYGASDSYDLDNRTKPKPRPEQYFKRDYRVAAAIQCAQVITLRTQLMPDVFEGNPTSVSVGTGKKLRTVQWGSNVYAAANFDASANQTVTLPSGAWYDYLGGGSRASSSYSLQPGELKVFTGTQIAAPTFTDIEKRDHTGIEEITPSNSPSRGVKVLRDGQLLIRRGDKTYTITGQLVNSK